MVAGIDFGTSRSGYAYSFVDDGRVVVKTEWPRQPVQYSKTLTQMLYGPAGVEAWGWETLHRLVELRQSRQAHEYLVLRNFKMEIHSSENRGADGPMLRRTDGRDVPVVSVVADYLKLLRDSLLADLHQETAGHLEQKEILWCLTVPAIWTDSDKALMRRAAVKAGLIGAGSDDAERLLLVLEPEAAALHCQEKAKVDLPPGTRFVVVDCGGGTVDITAHVVGPDGSLSELAPGTGGPYGSTYVDRAFLRHLLALLGPECYDWVHQEHPVELLELHSAWERAKCAYDPEDSRAAYFIPFSFKLGSALTNRFPHVLERMAELQGGYDEAVVLDRELMERLHSEILDGLIDKVAEQFSRLRARGCDYVFLVGGFSRSTALQRRIRKEFAEKVTRDFLLPPDPGSAVVEGAVSFGIDPSRIRSRRARLTYGCTMSSPFVPGIDPESKKDWRAARKQWYCEDRFCVFVSAGEPVDVDQVVTHRFHPRTPDQKNFFFPLLATSKDEVRYSDEPHVKVIGEVDITVPDVSRGLDRVVELSMHFGGTEIRVEAHDPASGRKATTSLRFSSTYFPELIGG